MLEVEHLTLTRVRSLDVLLLPSEQIEQEWVLPPRIMHLPTLEHFRCESDMNLSNIIGSQSRLVSLHLPRHSFHEFTGNISLLSLTSLTLRYARGLERHSVPALRELGTAWIEGVEDSIIPNLTSLPGTDLDTDSPLHRFTDLGSLAITVDYNNLLDWSSHFTEVVSLSKLTSLFLRVLDCSSSDSPVPDVAEDVYVVSVVKRLNALMLEHPTLERLHFCCQPEDDDEVSKVFTLQITHLSLAKYTKVDLRLCTDWHCFAYKGDPPVVLHQHDCFCSGLQRLSNQTESV